MEKIDTHNISYGKNYNDTKTVPLTDTCSQREYHEVLHGSEKFKDLVDKLDGMRTLEEEEYDPLF